MLSAIKRFSVVLTTSLLCAGTASASFFGTLGAGGGGTSTFVELDPATGSIIQTIGDVGYRVNGMTYDATTGTIFGSISANDPSLSGTSYVGGLITIDPTTGTGTPIGLVDNSTINFDDAVVLPTANSSGELFGWVEASQDDLVKWDKTAGTVTIIGDAGLSTGSHSLAFDNNDILYLVDFDNLYEVNTTTGATTLLGSVTGSTTGLQHHGDFNPGDNNLYAITESGSSSPRSIDIINISDPSNPVVVGTLPTVDTLHTLVFAGAFIAPPTDPDIIDPEDSGSSTVIKTPQTVALTVAPVVNALGSRTFSTFRAGKPGVGTLKPLEQRDTSMLFNDEIGLNAGDGMILLGVWGGYSHTELENDFIRTKYDGHRGMFLGGIDYSPSESLIMGIALGYEKSSIDTDFNNGDADSDGWTVAPYFGKVLNDVWNLDINFGYSNIDTDQDRAFGTITSDVDTERMFASASMTGYTQINNWLIVGRFGAMHAISEDDDYTESDSTTVDSKTTRLTQINIGGEATYPMGDFEPFIGATYNYDLMSDKLELTPDPLGQPDYERSDVLMNVGFRYYSKDNMSATLDISKRFGRSDYDEETLSFNLRWDFN